MKKPFKDPIAIKKQAPIDRPMDGKDSPWDFRCPQYDQRSSCYVRAGTDYGQGHAQPIGHRGEPKKDVSALPSGTRGFNEDPKY
jgi:hypothetical protein